METLTFLLTSTFYPPYHVGGDAIAVQRQAELLASLGHEVHVAFSPAAYAMKAKAGGRGEVLEVPEALNGVFLHPLWRGALEPVWAYLTGRTSGVERLERLSRELQPDVVHHHNISLLGLDVLKIRAERRLYTAHDAWLLCPKSNLFKRGGVCERAGMCWACSLMALRPPQLWRYGSTLQRALEGIDAIIAPSRFYAQLLGGLCESVHHVPNFCPPMGYHAQPEPYMLYSGVLEPHKGILQLAGEVAQSADFPYRLVVAGKGSLSSALASLASHHPRQLEYAGWLEQSKLDELRRRASFVVLPSVWYENCPMTVIEAYASGVPVLVSPVGGLPEMVRENESGFVLRKTLDDTLTAMGDADIYSLKRGALRMHESAYSPEEFLRKYMEIVS
ncbi:MAG: glycosyltransferase [Methermicoccaceae archaeon]